MFGKIEWLDLTVPDAEKALDFYQQVIGWDKSVVNMGDYDDFCVMPHGEDIPAAGICHARGGNADIPPLWIPYFNVENLDKSVQSTTALGGTLLTPIKAMGAHSRYVFIRDPAGAVCALFEKGS
ncbi:MAG: VOC family protein [Saprospiraceae bacterium]|nr:VOC family protein [Saprospiraceae bacterium]HPG08712.1 VOC family protein [Saprospiraceae bacterium]HPQ99911.1 VOC family protein [Saprospiraceae bacterium]HQU54681.1 VOC family protein [Saprospiraceae bacterium]